MKNFKNEIYHLILMFLAILAFGIRMANAEASETDRVFILADGRVIEGKKSSDLSDQDLIQVVAVLRKNPAVQRKKKINTSTHLPVIAQLDERTYLLDPTSGFYSLSLTQ